MKANGKQKVIIAIFAALFLLTGVPNLMYGLAYHKRFVCLDCAAGGAFFFILASVGVYLARDRKPN